MVRITDFNPNAELHKVVRKIPQGFMHRGTIPRNALYWIGTNHRADLLPVCVEIYRVRLIRAIRQFRAIGLAKLEGAVPFVLIFHPRKITCW